MKGRGSREAQGPSNQGLDHTCFAYTYTCATCRLILVEWILCNHSEEDHIRWWVHPEAGQHGQAALCDLSLEREEGRARAWFRPNTTCEER